TNAAADGAAAFVVLAADAEPGISSALRLFVDDPDAAVRAAIAGARMAGADRAILAVPESQRGIACSAAEGTPLHILSLPERYPEALPSLVARRVTADIGSTAHVVTLAAARDALAAIEAGVAPTHRVVTVLGPGGEPAGNYRVAIGMRLGDVLAAAGLEAQPGDLVATGGLYRGLAQYSLDAGVDTTIDAITLVRGGTFAPYADDPCVNCGACIDVCPENLQAHHLARFSEFGFFERTVEYGLDDCIECGICATVCPSRRPLLQRIRLAKREIAAAAAAEAETMAAIAAGRGPSLREPDPIAVPVATAKKD
ncbi:4Fe-4S dicluster domain-containing protein, partial [bacterium]|nr:4Fe-4S dicluster domain-containing protein [bacterium]